MYRPSIRAQFGLHEKKVGCTSGCFSDANSHSCCTNGTQLHKRYSLFGVAPVAAERETKFDVLIELRSSDRKQIAFRSKHALLDAQDIEKIDFALLILKV